jgi:adenylate cyclase
MIPSEEEVREQLARLLDSPEFATSRRICDFLRFVTERALTGEGKSIKQYTIGVEVYGRGPSFDPKSDPLVRIEAGRLRRALDKYYGGDGRRDPILVQVPRGTYVPRFIRNPAQGDGTEPRPEAAEAASSETLQPPVIVVLPMENLGEEKHAYLVNGIGEELTAELSRCSGIRVVAFCSSARSAVITENTRQRAASLGADYALTGVLRKSGKRIRINIRLLDVGSGEQLWAERFEEDLIPERLFDIEDRIVCRALARVADAYGVISRAMRLRAEGRRVSDPSAYEAILRHLHFQLTLTPDAFRESLLALEHAVKVEPNSAVVWAMLSQCYLDAQVFGYEEIPEALETGIRLAGRAVSLDPNCQFAQHAKAYASLIERNRAAMITAAERIIATNPNAAFMAGCASFWLCLAGEYDRGIELLQKSIELNPLFPSWMHAGPYFYNMHHGNFEAALHHANEFGLPDFFWGPLIRAAVLGLVGRAEEARTAYERILELKPDFSEKVRDYVHFFVLDDRLADKMLEGLDKAVSGERVEQESG